MSFGDRMIACRSIRCRRSVLVKSRQNSLNVNSFDQSIARNLQDVSSSLSVSDNDISELPMRSHHNEILIVI